MLRTRRNMPIHTKRIMHRTRLRRRNTKSMPIPRSQKRIITRRTKTKLEIQTRHTKTNQRKQKTTKRTTNNIHSSGTTMIEAEITFIAICIIAYLIMRKEE